MDTSKRFILTIPLYFNFLFTTDSNHTNPAMGSWWQWGKWHHYVTSAFSSSFKTISKKFTDRELSWKPFAVTGGLICFPILSILGIQKYRQWHTPYSKESNANTAFTSHDPLRNYKKTKWVQIIQELEKNPQEAEQIEYVAKCTREEPGYIEFAIRAKRNIRPRLIVKGCMSEKKNLYHTLLCPDEWKALESFINKKQGKTDSSITLTHDYETIYEQK